MLSLLVVCELYVNCMCCNMIDVVIIKSNALPLYNESVWGIEKAMI